MILLKFLKPFVYLWAGLAAIDDLSVIVKMTRLAFHRHDRSPDSLCDLCDDVMEKLLVGREGMRAVPCAWICLGRSRCTRMCEKLQEVNHKSGEFPCIAAGYCEDDEDGALLGTNIICVKGPLSSCEPKKFCRKRRAKFGFKYTCELKPGMGRWIFLKKTTLEHAKAIASGVLHQKRCHEPGAGPFCVAEAHGSGRAAECLTWFLAVCYGGYRSISAIESPGGDDDQQWLTFWVMFVAAMFLEQTFARVLLSRFPLYYQAKLVFTVWLIFFDGAATVYRRLRMRASQWSPALAVMLENRHRRVAQSRLNLITSLGGTLITNQIALLERGLRKNPKKRNSLLGLDMILAQCVHSSKMVTSWEYDYTETAQQDTEQTSLVAEERLHQISRWLLTSEGMRTMETSLDSKSMASLLECAAAVVSFQPKFLNVHLLCTHARPGGSLPAMDSDGKADCYIKFALISNRARIRDSTRIPQLSHTFGKRHSYMNVTAGTTRDSGNRIVASRIAYRTLAPIWNQRLEIPINGELDEDGVYRNGDIDVGDAALVVEAWDADCGRWGIALEVCRCAGAALVCAFVAAYVLGAVDFVFEDAVTAEQRRGKIAMLASALCVAAGGGLSWTMSVVLNADDEYIGNAAVPLAILTDRRRHALILNLHKGNAARGALRVNLHLSEN